MLLLVVVFTEHYTLVGMRLYTCVQLLDFLFPVALGLVQEVKKKLHAKYTKERYTTITQIFEVGAYLAYIEECVRVSWELCVQSPAMTLNCSEKYFEADFHHRFHSADLTSSLIKSFIWPTLLQSSGPTCVLYKGVVVT